MTDPSDPPLPLACPLFVCFILFFRGATLGGSFLDALAVGRVLIINHVIMAVHAASIVQGDECHRLQRTSLSSDIARQTAPPTKTVARDQGQKGPVLGF